jgi:hypothetical protein
MATYELTHNLNKVEFIQLVNNGIFVFYKPENNDPDSFHLVYEIPYFSIVLRNGDTCFICTNKNSITVSDTIHAIYRLFNLWQIGELK